MTSPARPSGSGSPSNAAGSEARLPLRSVQGASLAAPSRHSAAQQSTLPSAPQRSYSGVTLQQNSLSAPRGGEGRGEVGDSRAPAEKAHLTLPSLRDGPLPAPP